MSNDIPQVGRDAGGADRVQILATEHWSLLATRSLTFNESLGRVSIFLAILSGALIALALVAQADRFGSNVHRDRHPHAVGRAVRRRRHHRPADGAQRRGLPLGDRDEPIRRAYLDLHPDLEPHFVTSGNDDVLGALQTLGVSLDSAPKRLGSVLHLLQTLPGMLTVIVGAVAAAIGGLVALALALPAPVIVAAAAGAFALLLALMTFWNRRTVTRVPAILVPRFPQPV